jgi:hypothetical protein
MVSAVSDVFISYSKEDAGTARLISEKLQGAGFSVWWDRRILPGKTWDEVIGASLDSASCVVVLWSKVSVESRWVREEAERGADRGVLVPIFIEKVDPPFGFGRIEGADLSGWQGEASNSEFANLCDAINGFLKGPKKAPPVRQTKSSGPPAAAAPPATYTAPVSTAPANPNPPPPVASVQFFLGRWRVEGFNGGSDLMYFPDGSFNGVMIQNIGGYNNPMNVFGRWNMQVLGEGLFQLQLWFANMSTWAGTFRILDWDRIQNLESTNIALRVR